MRPQASGLELFPEIQLSLEMHEGVGGSFQTDIAVTKQNISMQTHLVGLGNAGQGDLVNNHDWRLGGIQAGQALNIRLRSSRSSYSKWESTELFSAAEKIYPQWRTRKVQRQGNVNVGLRGEVLETRRTEFSPHTTGWASVLCPL